MTSFSQEPQNYRRDMMVECTCFINGQCMCYALQVCECDATDCECEDCEDMKIEGCPCGGNCACGNND